MALAVCFGYYGRGSNFLESTEFMRSQRQLRVGEEIRHALASLLMRGDVPWPSGFTPPVVTVTEVKISPDLKNATVYIMPLGGDRVVETVRLMNEGAGFFRHGVGQAVTLRHVPKLRFVPDESFDTAQRIEEILLNPLVARDLKEEDQ